MPTWDEVKKYATDQIATLHRQLESHQPEHATQVMRGEVRAMRRILALEENGKPPDPAKRVQPVTPDL